MSYPKEARLPSEQETPEIEAEIMRVAEQHFGSGRCAAVFEHGHWWLIVKVPEEDRHYDVVDAEPGLHGSDFDFEEV